MNNNGQKNDEFNQLDLNELEEIKKSFPKLNINKLKEFIKKFECFYNLLYIQKSYFFHSFKRKFIYLYKYFLNSTRIKLQKKINIEHNEFLLYVSLSFLKKLIEKNNHKIIQQYLKILIKLSIDEIFANNYYLISVEIIIKLLINQLNSNIYKFYDINDNSAFNLINDVIESLISFPEETQLKFTKINILENILTLFDKNLFSQHYPNIFLSTTSIWLKLLSLRINPTEKNDINKAIYSFLIKIYKFHLSPDYMESMIYKNSILDMKYYRNALYFLNKLFWEEIGSILISDFKIKEGIFIPKNNFLFLSNIKPKNKTNEISIIFSFQLFHIEKNKNIEIMEFFDKKMQSVFQFGMDGNGYLFMDNHDNKKLETKINIKENKCYFICITIKKNLLKIFEMNFFFQNSNIDKGKNSFFSKKINNFDLSKEMYLFLGKTNFQGIIGEFLIINKKLKRKNIKDLFNLKEDYGYILRYIYYKLQILSKVKPKYKLNSNKPNEFIKAKEFFEKFSYEIIYEIRTCDILYSKPKKYLKNIDNNNNMMLDKNEIVEVNNNEINTLKKNLNIIKIISKMNYSYDIFCLNNGIDFLSFQLNNIFSKINDIELLNSYLYETLLFVIELISYQENYYENHKNQLKKLDTEIIIFFLTLLISLLNQKDKKIYLKDNIILKLIEIYDYFKTNKLIEQKNMILSIIFDIDFYKNKFDIFQNQKIFISLKNDIEELTADNSSLISFEFFYKILILDFSFETKKYKHKLLMEIISDFISLDAKKLGINDELCKMIHKEFINYFLCLNSEIKIYHYLKIIYFNFNNIKESFKENEKFIRNINESMGEINYNHCKYCAYNQILFYLIIQEIMKSNNDNDYMFDYYPNGFMMNPSIFFLKCFFSQIFNLSNQERLKFIKTKSDPIDFIFSLMNNEKEIFDINKFIPKLRNIKGYINLWIELTDINDTDKINYIIYFIKFIIDFLKRYVENENNYIKNNSNISLKNQKNDNQVDENKNGLQIIYYSNEMTKFFDIYLNINYIDGINELKFFINNSINKITSPFYFNYLSQEIIPNSNEKKYNKIKFFNIIIDELVKYAITYDLSKEKNIIQNNILFLIHLHNYVLNEYKITNKEFENLIILYITYLKENSFFDSKYVFSVYSSPDNESKENKKKFVLEIICDIYFHLYEFKKYDIAYECLIKGLFLDVKQMNILNIDCNFFEDNKNKTKDYIFYNENYLKNIAEGEDVQEIIFSVYFIMYLLEKKFKYEDAKINKDDKFGFFFEIYDLLLQNISQLIKQYNKKIKNSTKELSKKIKQKSYINFLDNIIKKYNAKNLTTNELIDYYQKTLLNQNKKFKRKSNRKKTITNSSYSVYNKIGSKIKIYESYTNDINNKEKANNSNKIPSLISFKQRSLSFSKMPFKRYLLNEKNEYTIDEDNKIEGRFFRIIKKKTKNINILKIAKTQSEPLNINSKGYSKQSGEKILDNLISKENEKYLKEKLKKLNLPSIYYKKMFRLSDTSILKRLFNPKEYFFWNKFNFVLKDIIFTQKKFGFLHKIFNIVNRNHIIKYSSNIEGHSFTLKYPSKLKNFICDDYYRPFTKPDLNFFNSKLLKISHSYLKDKFINDNNGFNIDKINKIQFTRILPFNYDELNPTSKVVCECVNDYGSIFGYLYINHAFLLFVSAVDEDKRISDLNHNHEFNKDDEFYLYSFFLEERRKDKNKYIIMYYSEIKEVVIRRFCFNYIGYEFFMKNNKSHLFNFFNKDNLKQFIQIMLKKLDEIKKNYSKSNNSINNSIIKNIPDNIVSLPILSLEINDEINFEFINDLVHYFDKCNFKAKHFKGEISNFKYLLLLNKYSSRSYNDLFQYLVFPLLYFDSQIKAERDLSKPIALNKNKSNYEKTLMNIQNNYDNFGCHFNYHYSTSGYILYYLVRMNPFTNMHIKFQSYKFDVPKRLFYSMDTYFNAISFSEENRELIPEFFCNFEIFLNLNYLNLGYLYEENITIHDLETGDANGIAEFIINMRQHLEKRDIIPWVDNIFGCNQYIDNDNIYNKFQASSYEINNNYEAMKKTLKQEGLSNSEIISQIREKLNLLSLGICPIKLFKNSLKSRKNTAMPSIRNSLPMRSSMKKSAETNFVKDMKNFLKLFNPEKSKMFLLDDNSEQNLVIRNKKTLHIFKLFNNDSKNNLTQKELWPKKHLKINPESKMFCTLYPEILLSCRYIDNIIQINYSQKYNFKIHSENIITSVEFLSHQEKKDSTNNNNIIHTNKVIIGDELGNLSLINIEYEINNKKQMNLKKTKIEKNIKAHNSLIQGILLEKRLNIIISYSIEGQITINNAFDFNVINIINIGNEFYIRDIKISEYDLIYIYCTNKEEEKFNYIKCYSLNGIKYTELKTEKKIINYFVCETLLVVYENNLIESFNLYDLEGNPSNKLEPKILLQDSLENNVSKKIIMCALNNLDKKLVIIYEDLHFSIEDVINILSKE